MDLVCPETRKYSMSFINLGASLFNSITIPNNIDVVFVSDNFIDDYSGGAELTSEALITSSPFNVFKLKSSDVSLKLLESGHKLFWIFGNYSNLDINLIPSICANINFSIIEYDYKYCKYRSIEKHAEIEQAPCNCEDSNNGKMVSAFMHAAASLWWMSEGQMELYHSKFPFLKNGKNTVLSSVFDDLTFAKIKTLREKTIKTDRWIVLGSPSWIKGTKAAEDFCIKNNLEYDVVWNVSYDEMLAKLAAAQGLVFMPSGMDTCPRLVIEAKLLGCKLHLNKNVQHKDEIWFDTDEMLDTESYLYLSKERFWNGTRFDMSFEPTISGYTTTKDCITQDYPFQESIESMLGFCDEVIVVDGGSTDGTMEALEALAKTEPKLIVHQQKRDWLEKRFAVHDGQQKALARSLCTKDFCWQMDSDEIVHEDDYTKIKAIIHEIPKSADLLALPMIEYWGSEEKVRCDVNLWKWRLSRNKPYITHGIPAKLRKFDENGKLYSAPGSDGCDYIRFDNYEPIPCINFVTPDVYQAQQASHTNAGALSSLNGWFDQVIDAMPSVHHYSWFNLNRKIKTYKLYWSKHWESLFDVKQDDTPEQNMFFDKAWKDVTDTDIKDLSLRLKTKMGGWVFHNKIDFSKPTKHLCVKIKSPANMTTWIERNK